MSKYEGLAWMMKAEFPYISEHANGKNGFVHNTTRLLPRQRRRAGLSYRMVKNGQRVSLLQDYRRNGAEMVFCGGFDLSCIIFFTTFWMSPC